MATAANRRIIIEKGADYRIELQVTTDGVNTKDLIGFSAQMVISYGETDGTITVLDTIAGAILEDVPGSGTYLNGILEVVIDKSVTSTYPTRVAATLDPFTTEFNYYYHIQLTEDDVASVGNEDLRVLRGRCAIRA